MFCVYERDSAIQCTRLCRLVQLFRRYASLIAAVEMLATGRPIREITDIDLPQAVAHLEEAAAGVRLDKAITRSFVSGGGGAQVLLWDSASSWLHLCCQAAFWLPRGRPMLLTCSGRSGASASAALFCQLSALAGLPSGLLAFVPLNTPRLVSGTTAGALLAPTDVLATLLQQEEQLLRWHELRLQPLNAGSSAALVLDSADLDAAARAAVAAAVFAGGQAACCTHRVLIQEAVAASFQKKVEAQLRLLVAASATDKNAQLGCMDRERAAHLAALCTRAQEQGATVQLFGQQKQSCVDGSNCARLVTGAAPATALLQAPLCGGGPLLLLLPYRSLKEGISMASHTPALPCLSVWSEVPAQAMQTALLASRASLVTLNWPSYAQDAAVCASGFAYVALPGFHDQPPSVSEETLTVSLLGSDVSAAE